MAPASHSRELAPSVALDIHLGLSEGAESAIESESVVSLWRLWTTAIGCKTGAPK